MKIPRAGTLIIAGQSVLLLACLGYLVLVLVQNYCLKTEAKRYAATVGFEQATRNFTRGHIWLLEVKQFKFRAEDSGTVPSDGGIEPAGKMDGQFEMYYYLVDEGFPKGHLEIQQAYVDAYNQHMRQFFDHPEWFDKNGQRISKHELKQQTNTSSVSD
jgi:hypothetical protein